MSEFKIETNCSIKILKITLSGDSMTADVAKDNLNHYQQLKSQGE